MNKFLENWRKVNTMSYLTKEERRVQRITEKSALIAFPRHWNKVLHNPFVGI